MQKLTLIILFFIASLKTNAQAPNYTVKKFISFQDTSKFKVTIPAKDGFFRTYISSIPEIFDLDDNHKTYIRTSSSALLCIEGNYKNKLRHGLVTFYLIDSFNTQTRYKIWEQEFENDKLNGQWRTYSLKGNLVNYRTYKDDSLNGISRNLWIDGKSIMSEKEFLNGSYIYISREYYPNEKIKSEIPFKNSKLDGKGKKFYQDGTLQEEANFTNGEFNGSVKYFHPNGQLWNEKIYKDGKLWTIVCNYTSEGKKRDPGSLKNGTGTVIYYNDDGSIRESEYYLDGILK